MDYGTSLFDLLARERRRGGLEALAACRHERDHQGIPNENRISGNRRAVWQRRQTGTQMSREFARK
jgi:hypothetical protein